MPPPFTQRPPQQPPPLHPPLHQLPPHTHRHLPLPRSSLSHVRDGIIGFEREQILRKCIRARQDSRIGAITASHARRHDPLQTATVWSETFYACCLLTLHLQRKGFLRSVRRFGNVFPPYSVIYLKHSGRKRRREADRDVTCAHVQLMHIFRIFGQTCAEYRLQETCSINYQVQHAPILAARLRHHHEIDHQWQQIRSHLAQAIWPKPFLVRCLLAAAMADPATKARLGERLASLPSAKLHTIADDLMEGFQFWGNEFKDYLPMSRHPCNPRRLEIGIPSIITIITSPRAISVGNAILRWQSRCKQATSIPRRQQCHHSQYIYIFSFLCGSCGRREGGVGGRCGREV